MDAANSPDRRSRGVPLPVSSLSHVGIAVPDLDAAIGLFRARFGAEISGPYENTAQKVRLAYVELSNAKVELIAPLGADSPLHRFLEKHPQGGLHHLALGVADAHAAAASARADNVRILGSGAPTPGHHGRPLFFLDPKALAGVLTEIEQQPRDDDPPAPH
jgi:methylmalonyl-CoA/ethylmalonyl-CoA epimerase